MFPVALDLTRLSVLLVGNNSQAARRLLQLDEAGAEGIGVYSAVPSKQLKEAAGDRLQIGLPADEVLSFYDVLMVVDLEENEYLPLVEKAKKQKLLVNVEDVKEKCDFFFSSIVRRGDLLISFNTNGKSPALSRKLRELFSKIFPELWKERVEEIGQKRNEWKKQGASFNEVTEKSLQYFDNKGWFKEITNG